MRRCLWPQVVQTQVADLAQWYPGPCRNKGRWDTAPGERGDKDTGMESCMPGGSGRAERIQRRDPAPKLPLCPVAFPCGVFGSA